MTQTPAYYGTALITGVKSTIKDGPGMDAGLTLSDDPFTDGNSWPETNVIKLFTVVIFLISYVFVPA
jgi:hypothetical protein